MGYDDVIPLIGDFGRYQKRIYFLLCLPAILCAFHKLGNVFLIAEPKYRCRSPDESLNSSYNLNRTELEYYYPYDPIRQEYSSCEIYTDSFRNQTQKCQNYVYDDSLYGFTAVIEWQLTCEKTYLIATSNALFMFGVMLGSIIFGELSDRYGRKKVFFMSLVIQVVFGVASAIAPEFWTFTLSRLVVGATTSGVFLVAYVIALEMVGPSSRLIAGTVCHMFFSVGYIFTALLALYFPDWRSLQLALTLPGVVFFCYWWFIPESSRWLITKHRIPEARRLILIAAKENKINIPEEQLDLCLVEEEKPPEKTATVLDIFKHSNLRKRALIIFYDWFANNITYYGLSWYTNNLAGNPYLNFVISGAVEIPGYTFLILTLNRWGRKNIMCGCMIMAGIALLLTVIIPKDYDWLIVTLAMFGKMSITASYGAVYIFSTEQFPTVIRNAGLGAGSTCARLGSILAPYINVMNKIWPPLPLITFGAIAFIGGCLSLVLPETLNKKLPETMEEGNAFGRKPKQATAKEMDVIKTDKNGTQDEESELLKSKENQKTENGLIQESNLKEV